VASDVLGVSSRAMIKALIDGERRGAALAELGRRVLRKRSLTCPWRWPAGSATTTP
jgi:hypothetical protein